MKLTKTLFIVLITNASISGQFSTDTIILNQLPDTLMVNYFSEFVDFGFSYSPGQTYDPDTLFLYSDSILITSIALPKNSVATMSESVTTPLHNGSGYELDNGFGVNTDFGYYLVQNPDGSIQMNDWTQTISGDTISSQSFGNQVPVEFNVIVDGQTDFLDPSLNTDLGEIEVYINGLRTASSEFSIDTSSTGIILNTGLMIGDILIIDID